MLFVAAGGTVSPAAFSTSVHNAPPALLSIALGHTGNLTALAGGPFSLEAAFESAVGLLFEAPQVLLICADLKPPVQTNAVGVTHAVGLLLGRQHETADPDQWRQACAKGPYAALTTRPLSAPETPDNRLDTMAWLLGSDERTFTHFDRHAAHIWAKTSRLEAETRHP